ncbi:MAG: AAA family ATPase [Pirellulaceae bacterium]
MVSEVDRLLQRDDRQGVLLIGPPAVGKTAIINECVQRRTARFHHRRDQKPQVWWLSPQRLISGMSYLGQWEQRWLSILRESSKRDHILYFDDLVGLFTAGRTRDSSLLPPMCVAFWRSIRCVCWQKPRRNSWRFYGDAIAAWPIAFT